MTSGVSPFFCYFKKGRCSSGRRSLFGFVPKNCGPLALLASGLPASRLHLSREFFIRTSPKFRIRLSPQGAFFAIWLGSVSSDSLFQVSGIFRLVLVLGQDGTLLFSLGSWELWLVCTWCQVKGNCIKQCPFFLSWGFPAVFRVALFFFPLSS